MSLLHNCCLLKKTRPWLHFTGQIDGNAWGYKALNSDLNTHFNVRNATRPVFVLSTFKSKWKNTYIKKVTGKNSNVLHDTEVGPGYQVWNITHICRRYNILVLCLLHWVRRGGVAIVYKDCLNHIIQPLFKASSFELLEALMTIDSCCG